MAFAVCDQGAAAAFTGLRLATEYARTGGCRRAVLAEELAAALRTGELAEDLTGRPTVVLGTGLADAAATLPPGPAREVRVASAGRPFTGVWWELADGRPGWSATGGRVVVADYDAGLGYLCMSTIDFPGP